MLKRLLLLFSLSALALGQEQQMRANCSAEAHDEIIKAHHDLYHGVKGGGSGAAHAALLTRQNAAIAVDAYFHIVVSKANDPRYANWQKMATDQMAVMNTAYNKHGISFTLKGSELTVNPAWAKGDDQNSAAMKKALRKGPYRALNIYFASDYAGLGTCSMPTSIGSNPTPATYSGDGCVVVADTMPGGGRTKFNLGMTAVHETGHWLGLFHTFNGESCDGDGDLIADTPAEKEQTTGCPASKDSCPDKPGQDPIHNYMDYGWDECYEEFTPGQEARMKQLWGQFRNGK
ncbi:peptidase m43 pregnancy-associated plasma-a [Diplodia corticola]|uniref:Peptidase m43 pregnancy-associated plasma-a n=1 Tax=Diplodia corticola TaxID=236234 RepID=A0A1J9QKU8_9PEZI|nr:peptidase m43 pregnancy-associated plasma-a [Diplodia corticola]OJD28690.1 peptidase m43 pregnancy-associated plasma-a [Diplodia corticola]